MSNILIIGGQLYNKGAQAMTFTVIDEIRQRELHQNIILLSDMDYKRSEKEKQKYSFSILPYNEQIKFKLLGGLYKLLYLINKMAGRGGDAGCAEQVKSAFRDADLILDISGFGITSQWPWRRSMLYIMNIIIAKRYGIPIYLLPQSFGPFYYKNVIANKLLEHEMKKYLPYPRLIFAREKQGFEAISKFTTQNLRISLDMVLLRERSIDIGHIYEDQYKTDSEEFLIRQGSVAIIPNEKILKNGNEEEIFKTYQRVIDTLLEHNKIIHLLSHSAEDAKICRKIKEQYHSNDCVMIYSADLNCFELEDVLAKYDFVIASRYHSIIHAYRNNVPAIALGWAVKYAALLNEFKQSEFCFDVRQNLDCDMVLNAVRYMIANCREEAVKIQEVRTALCKNDIFASIFEENKWVKI